MLPRQYTSGEMPSRIMRSQCKSKRQPKENSKYAMSEIHLHGLLLRSYTTTAASELPAFPSEMDIPWDTQKLGALQWFRRSFSTVFQT